jgi:hypothetical protein
MANDDDLRAGAAELEKVFPPEWREPALGEEQVLAWEAEHHVTLPEPFRTFVAKVSNGSVLGPPDDGLLPLGWLPDDYPAPERDLAADFPLTSTWFWEDDPEADKERSQAVFSDGAVVLGASDGPLYWLLVISGPQRGNIWAVSEVGAVALTGDDGEGLDFGAWVARWAASPETFIDSFMTA